MTVLITLTTAGDNTGPFDLYSNADGFSTIITSSIPRADLLIGYQATLPTGTTEVLLRSTGACNSDLYLIVAGAPTTTTTTSSTTSTTSSTTTPNPSTYQLAQNGKYARVDGCPLGTTLAVYLSASDYALFEANFYSFGGIGGGSSTTCTAIARNAVGTPITAIFRDTDEVTWKLTNGNFQYNEFQC